MFKSRIERSNTFNDAVREITEFILHERAEREGGFHQIFGLDETVFTEDMGRYFESFYRLVLEKNVAQALRKNRIYDIEVDGAKSTLDSIRFHNGEYGFRFNAPTHDVLHALISLARSKNKRIVSALTPEYERKKPYAEEVLAAIVGFPTPQIALQLRDEVLVAQFNDQVIRRGGVAVGISPNLSTTGPHATRKYIESSVRNYYGEGDGLLATLISNVTAGFKWSDPLFYRLMDEIAQNNGKDPYILYRIFMRESLEFMEEFAPTIRKPNVGCVF